MLTEVLTSKGRIDIAVFFEKTIYIVELKCNQSTDQAISQIKNRKYPAKYKNEEKAIKLIGINLIRKNEKLLIGKLNKYKTQFPLTNIGL